jgi:hypothetical protein
MKCWLRTRGIDFGFMFNGEVHHLVASIVRGLILLYVNWEACMRNDLELGTHLSICLKTGTQKIRFEMGWPAKDLD